MSIYPALLTCKNELTVRRESGVFPVSFDLRYVVPSETLAHSSFERVDYIIGISCCGNKDMFAIIGKL